MFGGGRKKSTPTFTIRDNSSSSSTINGITGTSGNSYSDNNNNNNHGTNKMKSNSNTSRYSDNNNNNNISSKEKVYKFGESDSTNSIHQQQQIASTVTATAQSSSSLSSMYQSNNNNNNNNNMNYPRANSNCSNASSATITTTTTTTTTVCVGTEAIAKSNIERNKKEFDYPKCGFIQPIEHSLLYNMIKEPTIYPTSVLIQHIQDEDYYQYIELNDTETISASSSSNTTCTVTNGSNQNKVIQQQEQQRQRVSYAQLSALLALSAENHPATYNNDNSYSNNSYSNTVSEVLGKVVIKFIISYSTTNDLDRAIEIHDLLSPVEKYATRCSVSSEFKAVAALYAGYTVTVLTANPLPGLVGFAVWNTKRLEAEQQIQNIKSYQTETARRSNIETCSLLDECE